MPVLLGQQIRRKGSQPEHAVPSSCWLVIPYYKINPSDLMASLSPTASAWKVNLLKWCQLTPSLSFIQRCPAERHHLHALQCVTPAETVWEGRTTIPFSVLVSLFPFSFTLSPPSVAHFASWCSAGQVLSVVRTEKRQQLLALILFCPLGAWMWHRGTHRAPPAPH